MAGQKRLAGAFMIQLDRIDVDPDQPRKQLDTQHIDELTASIKRLGVLQPISLRYVSEQWRKNRTLRDARSGVMPPVVDHHARSQEPFNQTQIDRYRIIAGECRFTASMKAGLAEIPAWVRTPEENEVLMEQVIENWQRSDLSPFEIADSLGILRDANGYTQSQLAEFTGKSKGEISKILSLLDLDPEVQQIARHDSSKMISRRHLYALREFSVDRQLKLLSGIKDGRYTAESIELLAANQKAKRTSSTSGNALQRRSFQTRNATVSIQFRKSNVSDQDILEALNEAKRQVAEDNVA